MISIRSREVFLVFGTSLLAADKRMMNADEQEIINDLTERVLGAVFEVSNTLGCGFLEMIYENAMIQELLLRGIRVASQVRFPVRYKGKFLADYYADLVVEGQVLVELKCVERLGKEHMAQCINQQKASGLHVCLLVNFQRPVVEYKRIVLDF